MLQSFVCLAVHCCRVVCVWLYTVTGLHMLGCTLVQSYVCLVVHCYMVECDWLYTVRGLCVLGCTLLQG